MTKPVRIGYLAFLPLVALVACKSNQASETGIIVEITSDLVVPHEINQVRVSGKDPQGNVLSDNTYDLGIGANRVSLPFRTGLRPVRDTSTAIHIEVVGQLDGAPVVSRSATLSFIHGKQVVLPLSLLAVCKPVKCTVAYSTCKDKGTCEPDGVVSTSLPTYTPNQPVPGQDAATRVADVGGDAATVDARPDAAPERQPDGAMDAAKDVPLGTGTFSGTGTASATSAGTGTASASGSGTGQSTGSTTGTGTGGTGTGTSTMGTGTGTKTGTGSGSTVTTTGTGTAKSTGSVTGTVTGTGTGTGDTNTGTGTGTGTGKSAGTGCSGTGECQAGLTCLDGVCCTQTSCAQCQNCGAAGTCSITVSSADDTTGATCTGTSTCNASGVCKKKSGESCNPTRDECAVGTCTDNRCCSQTCGVCQACTGAGGTCVAVMGAEDADTCSGTRTCNASGVCKKKDGQACTAAGDCLSGSCNSSNVCGPTTTPSRCVGLAATCGPSGNGDCCASLPVTGGTFYRGYDGIDFTNQIYPATVSDFYLDKYEITVGRFRQFVEAGKGTQLSPPAAGDGVHPLIAGSGWNATWNTSLAADKAALTTRMKCRESYQTWTDTAGANESRPINCLDWYTAFAFCAWDGGRLATEAEWNFAASGGNEQRYYPWSTTSTVIDDSYAVYGGSSTQNVGSKSPKGDGKWGQSDLAGNVYEWTLDWYASYVNPCNNCAYLNAVSDRVFRGGDFYSHASFLLSASRNHDTPENRYDSVGVRCARTGL